MPQVTLHDVAAASGVSSQTVSLVINQRPDVAEATRAHVWETIRQDILVPAQLMMRGSVMASTVTR